MKTGFSHGFADKMGKKAYDYHGVKRECPIQPEIPPYIDPDMAPLGPAWVLAWQGYLHTSLGGITTIYPTGFLYSSDPHPCTNKKYCTKNMYYFAEVYLYRRKPGSKMTMAWSDGIGCKLNWDAGYWDYWYKAWFDYRWCGQTCLFWVYKTGVGSWGRIWKSETGEFPGGYPVPPGEEHRP